MPSHFLCFPKANQLERVLRRLSLVLHLNPLLRQLCAVEIAQATISVNLAANEPNKEWLGSVQIGESCVEEINQILRTL